MTFLVSSILLAGCVENNEDVHVEKDCGCDATFTEFTIPDDEPIKASITYVKEDPVDITGEFSFKYVLRYGGSVLPRNGGSSFYICNEELIPEELKTEAVIDSVYFSGKASTICDKEYRIINGSINHIILTKLEKK